MSRVPTPIRLRRGLFRAMSSARTFQVEQFHPESSKLVPIPPSITTDRMAMSRGWDLPGSFREPIASFCAEVMDSFIPAPQASPLFSCWARHRGARFGQLFLAPSAAPLLPHLRSPFSFLIPHPTPQRLSEAT